MLLQQRLAQLRGTDSGIQIETKIVFHQIGKNQLFNMQSDRINTIQIFKNILGIIPNKVKRRKI